MPPSEPWREASAPPARSALRGAALLLASGLLAATAFHQAALGYWRDRAPARPPAALAGDPLIRVTEHDAMFEGDGSPQNRPAPLPRRIIAEAARAALRLSPLNPAAMRQLGMTASANADPQAALPWLAASQDMSRRDLLTQIALVNAEVARGDLPAVLLHYDRALRVSQAAGPALYPSLARALPQQDVQAELLRYAGSPWFMPFLADQLRSDRDIGDISGFIRHLRPALSDADRDKLAALMLIRLLRAGRFAEAATWLARTQPRLAPGLGQIAVTSLTMDTRLGDLAWRFPPAEGIDLTRDASGALAVSADPGRRATFAERLTLLPSGAYAFELHLAPVSGTAAAELSVNLACKGSGGETVVARFTSSPAEAASVWRGRFAIDAACPAQHWSILAGSPSLRSPAALLITSMELARNPR